jgi:hypothetical protein
MLLEKVSVHKEIIFVYCYKFLFYYLLLFCVVTEKKCTLKQNVCSGKIVPYKNLGKKKKNQNHPCTIRRNTTNSFIPLGSNIQFSTNTEKEQIIKKKLVTINKYNFFVYRHLFKL